MKTEMWYIVEAEEGASLVYGLKESFDETTFRQALAKGTVEELLNYVPVHKGDVFFIPQGLVHAIGKGILIAEIQENSNVTYRVYDYGRLQNGKPRELHVEEAIGTVKDFTPEGIDALRYSEGKDSEATIAHCPLFRVDRHLVNGTMMLSAEEDFLSVICLDGEGSIGGEPIRKGDSYFLPKGISAVCLEGHLEILITTR